jgi:hypothetical protein
LGRWFDNYGSFLGQMASCASRLLFEIDAKSGHRICTHIRVERATQQIDLATDKVLPNWRLTKPRVAEVAGCPAPHWVCHPGMGSVESPYVEVLDAGLTVEEVQRSALAERHGDESIS